MKTDTMITQNEWDAMLSHQQWRPFLQSWNMGNIYEHLGQSAIRIGVRDGNDLLAICFGHVVPARRGRHLSIPYGPVYAANLSEDRRAKVTLALFEELGKQALSENCSFIRCSPFLTIQEGESMAKDLKGGGANVVQSPLHLLAEHLWLLPLKTNEGIQRNEEEILMSMRKTTRNLIRRAERDGVTVTKSGNPEADLHYFLTLHDETRKRHGFTPYSDRFFLSQIQEFAPRNECSLYLAWYQGTVIAASIHMHTGGETSYHHGASSSAHHKIPASYLLQWTAIRDAIRRGDRIYNFWGIAPLDAEGNVAGKLHSHPFGGVTLFKTGFGGEILNLMHCIDIPLKATYWITYWFEKIRKWRRGF